MKIIRALVLILALPSVAFAIGGSQGGFPSGGGSGSGGGGSGVASSLQFSGGNVPLSGATANSECLQTNSSGTLLVLGSCGGSASYPAGAPPQFGGFSATNTSEAETLSGDCTFTRAGTNSYTIACTKTAGTPFGTAATVNTGTSGATIPLLNATNTWSGAQTYNNSDILLLGSSTGKTTFTSANAGASNFTLTFPAATDTLVDLAGTQTLTNKSIAGSEINSGTVSPTVGGSGLSNPTAHSLLMGEGSSNFNVLTAATAGNLIIDQGSGSDFAGEPVSGDCTITKTGAITCLDTNGVAFGTAATKNTGTSGGTVPLLNAANTWSADQTFNNNDISLLGSSTGSTTFASSNASATNYTITFPALTDTVTLNTAVQTLTNKSIAASEINSGQLAVANGGTGDATFTANEPLIGNGTSALNQGTLSGNTTEFATVTGGVTSGHCVQFDPSGNIEDAGASCSAAGGVPIYTHTITESAGAATLLVNSSSTATLDSDYIAMNAGITITTPASSAMADGQEIYVNETTSGVSYTTTFSAGAGTSLASIVLGDGASVGSATACGSIPATGSAWFKFKYRTSNTTLTLLGCGISLPPSTLAAVVGGSGVSNPTAHGVLVGEGSSPFTPVGPDSTSGQPLLSQGASSDPAFGALSLSGSGVTGTLPVTSGGTNLGTLTAHGVVIGEGTSSVNLIGPDATSGVPMISQGNAADPTFGAISLSGGSSVVTSQLPVANGGTNLATITAHGVMLGEGTSSVAVAGPDATSGQPLLSQGASSDPSFGAVSLSGSGVTGTLGAGNGGSGVASPTAHSLLMGEGSSAFNLITAATGGDIIIDQGSGADFAEKALSGDCTITSSGAITCTKSNGSAFGTAAFDNTGTSGGNIPLLNGTNTWSGAQTIAKLANPEAAMVQMTMFGGL